MFSRKSYQNLTVLALVLFLGATQSWAQALRVGFLSDNPPFGLSDTPDRRGIEFEMVGTIARELHKNVTTVKLNSLQEGEQKLEAGTLDIVVGSIKLAPELQQRFSLSNAYYRTGLGVVVPSTNTTAYFASDLTGKAIGAIRGSNADRLIENFIPQARLEMSRTFADALTMLQNGEVEAIVHDKALLSAEVAHNKSLRLLDVSLSDDDYVLLLRRNAGALLVSVNQSLARMRSPVNGGPSQLDGLIRKYGIGVNAAPPPPSYPTPKVPTGGKLPDDPSALAGRNLPDAKGIESRLNSMDDRFRQMEAQLQQATAARPAATSSGVSDDRIRKLESQIQDLSQRMVAAPVGAGNASASEDRLRRIEQQLQQLASARPAAAGPGTPQPVVGAATAGTITEDRIHRMEVQIVELQRALSDLRSQIRH